jgi:hypothetical protein
MSNVVLEAVGVESYADLYNLDASEVLTRIDKRNVPLHVGDAFLAVLVLRAVDDLGRARHRFERGTMVVAILALAVAFGQLAAAL